MDVKNAIKQKLLDIESYASTAHCMAKERKNTDSIAQLMELISESVNKLKAMMA